MNVLSWCLAPDLALERSSGANREIINCQLHVQVIYHFIALLDYLWQMSRNVILAGVELAIFLMIQIQQNYTSLYSS